MLRLHSYLFTYLLAPWSKVLIIKLTCSQIVKKFLVFYGNESSLLHSLVLKLHSVGISLLRREHWWNDTDGKNRSASQCLFFHQKSYTDWPGIESGRLLCS